MSFDFETVDEQLGALLTTSLPGDWRVQDAANGTPAASLSPSLTYLQTDVSNEWPGQGRLRGGYYAVSFSIELAVPEKDLIKAGKRLMRLLPIVFNALDSMDDLEWSDAEKGVSPNGVAFYTIPATVLAQYNPNPTEE